MGYLPFIYKELWLWYHVTYTKLVQQLAKG